MAFFNWWKQQPQAYHDKAFKRADLPAWDARWHKLSVQARYHLLHTVKANKAHRHNTRHLEVSADRFPPHVLNELVEAGFVTVQSAAAGRRGRQATLVNNSLDFVVRLRALRRYHLLAADLPSELKNYVNYCFTGYELTNEIQRILQKAGIDPYGVHGDIYDLYVSRRRWPGWVVDHLNDSLAQPILDEIDRAGGRLPLGEVATRLPQYRPDAVRKTLDDLIARLALFEDLDAVTYDLQVGLLPSVLSDRERANRSQVRPPLEPYPLPEEPGPEGGTDIPDLRALLLELAAERARLRNDRTLYKKEHERFEGVLEPLPRWLVDMYRLTPDRRLEIALHWAKRLQFVEEWREGDQGWLALGPAGQKWLKGGIQEQYAAVYDVLRDPKQTADPYSPWSYTFDDSWFLGATVTVKSIESGRPSEDYGSALKPEQRDALRTAVYGSLRSLPVGVFHRLDNVVAHAGFGPHNPLLLGRQPEQVRVFVGGRHLPPLEEQLQEVARHLFGQLMSNRLIPLGCLQAGRDAEGELLIARRPRLDLYFGQAPAENPAEPAGATRVIVQPDFSIIVIGLDPQPLVELAPFCERIKERSSSGATTFKLTRASILKAATTGLTGPEILERLQRHSSTPLPGNVAHEVSEWAGWVRTVRAAPATVFRCPDPTTADRVISSLGRQAERLNETTVAFTEPVLSEAIRRKLLEQGLLLGPEEEEESPPNERQKRRK
jgi:hypothetical protein